jgi:hypothetical protein
MKQTKFWYSMTLGDGLWAPILSAQIEETFLSLFDEAGKPVDMAIFTRNESEGRLHCEVIACFSPTAQNIARIFDAEPCKKPLRDELGFLAGDPHCWALFFPGSNL